MKVALVVLVVLAVALKLLQDRLPGLVYRFVVAVVIFLPLVGTAYAIWRLWDAWIGPTEIALFLGFYLGTGLGLSVGFHRLLAHRSFETGRVVTAILLGLGSMAAQGRCIDWVAHHRKHHANSDREGDPHSPLDGFLHAHVGWVFRDTPTERGRYCKRLLEDRLVRAIDATSALWVALGLLIPYLIAGWRGLVWGGLVRIAFVSHVTFAVNSFGHVFGSQPFLTGDGSRNNLPVALLAVGEGWHNNHHAFPSMAYFGIGRRQPDLGGAVIRLLGRLGLAWNIKGPRQAAVERRRGLVRPAAG